MHRRVEDDPRPAGAGGKPVFGPAAGAAANRRTRGLAMASAAAAAGAVVWLLWWMHAASLPAGAPAGSPWLAALALVVVAAACVAAGRLLARARSDAALHDARAHAQALGQLIDAWQWQTDAEHRLVRWQPPLGAPGSAWAGAAAGATLWERFDDAEGTLRARMQAQAPLPDLRLRAAGHRGAPAPWLLRGQPRLDALGRFAGHMGIARPLDETLALRADQAGLDALLRALPAAVWLLERADDGAWRVRRANAAAGRRVEGIAPGAPWERVLAGLPESLRGIVDAPDPVAVTDGGDCVFAERLSDDARLVALLPRTDDGADRFAAEHASFSYTVSHDLRAPLRVVEGFTRIVQEDYGRFLDRIGNDHLERVLAAAARMHAMIDAMLALAQLSAQPLAHQPVDLSQLAAFVVDDLSRQSPERHVEAHVEAGLTVPGDPTLLRIVLENLLGNAWKYTAKTPQPRVSFESRILDGRRVFIVRDNGAGFDMRFADRLFGVFQRLHSANDYQGTGVGLASVRRIVRRHGGDIWAEAEVGQGARFYFTIG